jgi:hypothetical protein
MSFKSVQKGIAKKGGYSMESAGAILANASRHASPAAKRANPKLKRVKGKMDEGGVIPETGAYEMEEGEMVIPAPMDMAPDGSVDCGDCCSKQLPPAPGAAPVRFRHNKPEGGSLVTSEVRPMLPEPDNAMQAERERCFTRHGADRIAYPGMSGRDWDSEKLDTLEAPNTKEV